MEILILLCGLSLWALAGLFLFLKRQDDRENEQVVTEIRSLTVEETRLAQSNLLAAKQLGRRWIGGELDIQFVEMARGRLGENIAYKDKVLPNGLIQTNLFANLDSSQE